MTYAKQELSLLNKIVDDIDLQLKEFNEIVPYEYNKDAYSPRLVNLFLTTCTVIESFCKLIQVECNLPTLEKNGGIRGLLKNIDKNGVLSNMEWITDFNEHFQPFDGVYDWWSKNNDAKHDLKTNILNIKYRDVLTTIVALHSLERLANAKFDEIKPVIGLDLLNIATWEKKSNRWYKTTHDLFHTFTAPRSI